MYVLRKPWDGFSPISKLVLLLSRQLEHYRFLGSAASQRGYSSPTKLSSLPSTLLISSVCLQSQL